MDKVRAMLSSNDLEMVRLGALLLQKKTAKANWGIVLSECLDKSFVFTIRDGEIQISKASGIWEQLDQNGYRHSYNIDTFSLETFKEAINEFQRKDSGDAKVWRY